MNNSKLHINSSKTGILLLRYAGLIFLLMLLVSCAVSSSVTTTEDLVIKILTKPDPPVTGDGQLLIFITRHDGQPVNDVKVSLSVTASGMQSGTQDGRAVKRGAGVYVYPVKFHMESKYTIRLWVYRNENVIAFQDSEIVLR